MTLLEDERYLGATPGMLITLHTWGRQLTMHPHIHCLVTTGGYTPTNEWKPVTHNYLLPIRVVKSLFRSKFQALIKDPLAKNILRLPTGMSISDFYQCHKRLYKKEWNIRIQEQYSHSQGVMLYLARHMKGGPINPKQICACTDKRITFRYRDHRDEKTKLRHLPLKEVVRRILWHVPETGIHTIRHYGLYAIQCNPKWAHCHALLGTFNEGLKTGRETLNNILQLYCRQCGAVMHPIFTVYRNRHNENSYI